MVGDPPPRRDLSRAVHAARYLSLRTTLGPYNTVRSRCDYRCDMTVADPAYSWITLTTDYGLSDGFVAACHGVIARRAPAVRVIDITHLVPPGDIRRGSAVLAQTVSHLPPAVHVAVVDPGVGTSRRG